MSNIQKVNDFLTESKVFYLTTVDGDKPKARPISFHMLIDDKLYFGVGTFKEVYQQMSSNPNVEFCATCGANFLRYFGTATFDPNPELTEKALDSLPMLKNIYNETTGNKLGIFYLTNATAEFRSMLKVEETINF